MAEQWFYAREGQQSGPMMFHQLSELARSGGLAPTDLVWREGTPDWTPAGEVAGLFATGGPYGTPPAPPPMHGAPVAPMPVQPIGYAGPYKPQYQAYAPGTVPNYLAQAIIVTILCCWPFGIPAIVYAAQVNGKLAAGDYQGAINASKSAKMWSWIAFGLGAGVVVIYLLVAVVAGTR